MYEAVSILFIVYLVLTVRVWTWTARRWQSGKTLVEPQALQQVPWTFLDVVLIFLLFVAMQAVAGMLLHLSGVSLKTPLAQLTPQQMMWLMVANGGVTLTTSILAAGWLRGFRKASWRDLGSGTWQLAGADLRIGLAAFLLVVPVVYLMQFLLARWMPSQHPLLNLLRDHPQPQFFWISGLLVVLVAPLTEEFFFRVIVQGWLEKWWRQRLETMPAQHASAGATGTAPPVETIVEEATDPPPPSEPLRRQPAWFASVPIVGSSLLFAAAHLGNGPDPIPLFFFALALGYLYQRTHRLLPCVVLHAALNGCSLLAMVLYVYGPKT